MISKSVNLSMICRLMVIIYATFVGENVVRTFSFFSYSNLNIMRKYSTCFSEGLLNEYWTVLVRTEIANEIMNLTSLNITHSYDADHSGRLVTEESATGEPNSSDVSEIMNTNNSQANMLKSGKFWLAIAALSLLKESQWLELAPLWQSLQVSFLSRAVDSYNIH